VLSAWCGVRGTQPSLFHENGVAVPAIVERFIRAQTDPEKGRQDCIQPLAPPGRAADTTPDPMKAEGQFCRLDVGLVSDGAWID
jgi:hypothetical protein